MKSKIFKFLKIGLPVLLGVFLIFHSYQKFTPEQLIEIQYHFKNADYKFIALALFLMILSHLSRAWRWKYQLNPMGFKPKFGNSIMAILVGYVMNLLIPRSGELSRAVVMNKHEGIPVEKGFGTIVSERIADLFLLMLLIGMAFVLQFETLQTYLSSKINPTKMVVSLFGLGLLSVLILIWVFKTTLPIGLKLKKIVLDVKEGVFSIFKMEQKWAFIGHSILIWALYVLMFYTSVFAIEETNSIPFDIVLTAFVVGSLTMAFTNGGFGSYPYLIAEILALFFIPETVGTAFGWIVWSSQTIMVIIMGGLAFLFLPIYNKQK